MKFSKILLYIILFLIFFYKLPVEIYNSYQSGDFESLLFSSFFEFCFIIFLLIYLIVKKLFKAFIKIMMYVVIIFIIFKTPNLIYITNISGNHQLADIYLILYALFIFLLIFILIFRFFKKRKAKKEKTDYNFATQIKQIAITNEFAFKFETTKNDIIIGNPFRGILCIGSAGSGKSVSILRQIIKQSINYNFSGILYDFKYPTLTNELKSFLKAHNSNIIHFNINFDELDTTSRINPLNPIYLKNTFYIREFATSLINNLDTSTINQKNFFTRSSIDILTATIIFLKNKYPQYCTLPHVVALSLQTDEVIINLLKTDQQAKGYIQSVITAFESKAQNQLAAVLSTLQSLLAGLNSPELFYILSGDDFNLKVNDKNNPIWLSIGNNPSIAESLAPVISLIITVATKMMNTQNNHHSIFLLDEAPTIYIPNLDMIPATGRANKIALAYFAQDISQIQDKYGDTKTEVFLGNLNTQMYGRVSSQRTTEQLSKYFGKYDQMFMSASESKSSSTSNAGGSSGKSKTVSYSVQQRDRLSPQDFLKFESGRFVGFTVESPTPQFNELFKMIDLPVNNDFQSNISNFKIDLNSNYNVIFSDIDRIVNSLRKTTS